MTILDDVFNYSLNFRQPILPTEMISSSISNRDDCMTSEKVDFVDGSVFIIFRNRILKESCNNLKTGYFQTNYTRVFIQQPRKISYYLANIHI